MLVSEMFLLLGVLFLLGSLALLAVLFLIGVLFSDSVPEREALGYGSDFNEHQNYWEADK